MHRYKGIQTHSYEDTCEQTYRGLQIQSWSNGQTDTHAHSQSLAPSLQLPKHPQAAVHSWKCCRLTQRVWVGGFCSPHFFYKLTPRPPSEFIPLPTFL